jgi:hypothetical protein
MNFQSEETNTALLDQELLNPDQAYEDLEDGALFDNAEEVIELEIADDDELAEAGDRSSVPGTVVSVLVHVWLLWNFAQLTIEEEPNYYTPPIDTRVSEVVPIEEEIQFIDYELANPDERELEVKEVVNAASVGLSQSIKPKVEREATPIDELIPDLTTPLVYDIPEGVQVDDRVVVKGTTGEAMVQLESALDLVTWEIAQNLKEKRVLVVWLLDASGSVTEQRLAIAKRLKRIYGELDALKQTDQIPRHEKPLLSGVVLFGAQTTFLTPNPTADVQVIHDAIANAPTDPSGAENIFTAVQQTVRRWSRYRTEQFRRIMLITLTDEAGDDFSTALEPAIKTCQRYGVKAYVIGPTAVFGRRKGYVPYVAPENGQTYRLPIDLGPESAVIENVDLPFWYSGDQYQYISSGFAPYALARLVHETGGVYFMTNMTTMKALSPLGVFDSATLKPFAPDYSFGTIAEYRDDLKKHPIRRAVVAASFASRQYKAKGTPTLELRVTPQNFKSLATEAQKSVAESQLMIETVLLETMPKGIEKQLEKEPSQRWRMNFCLTYGRLLAQKVRCREYNAGFAFIKNDLAADDVATKSNHWIVRPSRTINYAGNFKKVAALSESLLRRVIEEAPGTPWAVLAQRELKDGYGIKIEQRFIPPPPPAPRRPANANPPRKRVLFAAEQKKAAAAKKPAPKPKPPKLPRL